MMYSNAELFEKGKAVINSCTTEDQMKVALRYKHRLMRRWVWSESSNTWEDLLTEVWHDKQRELSRGRFAP